MLRRCMFDPMLLRDQLEDFAELVQRIVTRMEPIHSAEDFLTSEEGRIRLDSICLVLIAIGETVKKIEKTTGFDYLAHYDSIPWKKIKGARDFMAHEYFGVDPLVIYKTCIVDIPILAAVITQMQKDLNSDSKS